MCLNAEAGWIIFENQVCDELCWRTRLETVTSSHEDSSWA
jgi:hypothetical protein